MPDLGRERSIAEACRGARIPREPSRSAKSPLPTRSRLSSSDLATPFPLRVEPLDRQTEEDGEADRPFITAPTLSNAQRRPGGARVLRLRPTYQPFLTIRRY